MNKKIHGSPSDSWGNDLKNVRQRVAGKNQNAENTTYSGWALVSIVVTCHTVFLKKFTGKLPGIVVNLPLMVLIGKFFARKKTEIFRHQKNPTPIRGWIQSIEYTGTMVSSLVGGMFFSISKRQSFRIILDGASDDTRLSDHGRLAVSPWSAI